MFSGYKVLNNKYILLFLNNNYEFSSDINTNRKKENKIINESIKYLFIHNLNFNDKLYYVSNGYVIGYMNKNKLK